MMDRRRYPRRILVYEAVGFLAILLIDPRDVPGMFREGGARAALMGYFNGRA